MRRAGSDGEMSEGTDTPAMARIVREEDPFARLHEGAPGTSRDRAGKTLNPASRA